MATADRVPTLWLPAEGPRKKKVGENWQHNCKIDTKITRRKVLKVAKVKDANYGEDEGK